jgi:hypothetical protein
VRCLVFTLPILLRANNSGCPRNEKRSPDFVAGIHTIVSTPHIIIQASQIRNFPSMSRCKM